VISLNEVSGNMSAVLRFSDPDGPSGRSGWSFGLCQFDTKHNDSALACLRECGFTADEIRTVVEQAPGSKALGSKLKADVVARYDEQQLSLCLQSAVNSTTGHAVIVTDTGAILALADYVNQYGSIGPSFIEYLDSRDDKTGGVTIADVQEWKLSHTKYGREHRDDCRRRYNNILAVLQESGLSA
jgi:hypothetical protein